MKKLNNKGFGIAGILIVVVVVGLIGAVGWLVYDRQNSKESDPIVNNQTTNQEPIKDSENEKVNSGGNIESNNFLVIDEWGIKISIRDFDKVVTSTKDEKGNLSYDENIKFDSYAIPAFKAELLKDQTCKPGLSLYRSKTKFEVISDDSQKQIGEYYYFITGAPGPCSEDPENNPDDQLKRRFLEDFKVDNIYSSKQ